MYTYNSFKYTGHTKAGDIVPIVITVEEAWRMEEHDGPVVFGKAMKVGIQMGSVVSQD